MDEDAQAACSEDAPLGKRLRHWILCRTLGPTDRAFMFLLGETWTWGFLREYMRARRFARSVHPERVRRVFFFSYSRSGTHNMLSRFHYLPCCFAFKENLFRTPADPYQSRVQPGRMAPRFVLGRSMFGEYGLQDKNGADLSHLFLWNNYYLEDDAPVRLDGLQSSDMVVFYVRNFLRVLCSRDKAGRTRDKPRMVMTDSVFGEAVRRHRLKLAEMLRLADMAPERVLICFHERFCAQTHAVMSELCEASGIPPGGREGWDDPRRFFARCFGGNDRPVEKDGRLWCGGRRQYILGTGGEFNPLPQVSLARTLADPVGEWMTPSRRSAAQAAFGRSLVEMWMHDATFPYATVAQEDLVASLRQALVSG